MATPTPEPTTTGNPISPKVISAAVLSGVTLLLAYFVDNSLLGDGTAAAGFDAALRDLVSAVVGAGIGGYIAKDPRRAVSRH